MGSKSKSKSNGVARENAQNKVKNGAIKNGGVKSALKDPMSVTWMEKYSEKMENIWAKIPNFIKPVITTLAVFAFGLSINGEWLHIAVHIAKQFGYISQEAISNNATFKWSEISLESLRLQHLQYFFLGSVIISYVIYFGIGGFLHWYFYVRQRDRPEDWKCQPQKWLSPELERHEIMLGSATIFVNDIVSALLACYIYNGGPSSVYYNLDDYPLWWLVLQFPVIFIYQDYGTYLLHRMYHAKFLYKHFHKLHHKYKQPTAFSVTAIHPVESVHIQLHMAVPLFLFPIHWAPFAIIALYTYYHGIITHSGVNLKSSWWQPWQPDVIFHDNHHQYFHVNFGFNIQLWDKLHGTYRRKDRLYTEDTFSGVGKALTEATEEELKADLEERCSENPNAYRGNKLEFELTEEDLKHINKAGNKKKKVN